MSEFLLSTTGTLTPIDFPDIGSRDFAHPIVDLDMIGVEGFSLEELRDSVDIAAALDAGHITVKDSEGNAITDSDGLMAIPQPHILLSHEDTDGTGLVDNDVLVYDLASDTWKPAAGRLATKAGKILAASMSGSPKTVQINFATAFADPDYAVVLAAVTTNTSTFSPSIASQLAASFIINLGSASVNNLVQINWIAIKSGES